MTDISEPVKYSDVVVNEFSRETGYSHVQMTVGGAIDFEPGYCAKVVDDEAILELGANTTLVCTTYTEAGDVADFVWRTCTVRLSALGPGDSDSDAVLAAAALEVLGVQVIDDLGYID